MVLSSAVTPTATVVRMLPHASSDRRALLVVQIEHHILNTVFRPFLGNDLAAVQNELMRDAVNHFARAYTVGIVGVGRESLYAESKMFFESPNRSF